MASISWSTMTTLERHRSDRHHRRVRKKRSQSCREGKCRASVKATSLEDGELLPGPPLWRSGLHPADQVASESETDSCRR